MSTLQLVPCDGCGELFLVPSWTVGWCWCPDCRDEEEVTEVDGLPYEPYIYEPDEAPDAACDRCSYWTGIHNTVDAALATLLAHEREEHCS